MRRGRILALLPLALSIAAAEAATVQKCRRSDGTVAYQSAPCGPGERVLATWDAPPDPVVPDAPRAASTARRAPPARARPRAARAVRTAAVGDPCRAAKERRDAIERRVGLARTYELLSALQREVYDACR